MYPCSQRRLLTPPCPAIVFALLLLWVSSFARAQYLDFRPVGVSLQAERFAVGDLDHDGGDEIACGVGNHVYIYGWSGERLAQRWQLTEDRSWNAFFPRVHDLDGDGKPELSLQLLKPDRTKLVVYSFTAGGSAVPADSFVVMREAVGGRLDERGPFAWDTEIVVQRYLKGQGAAGVCLLDCGAGWSLQPRGVLAFSRSLPHRLLWSHLTGPCPRPPFPILGQRVEDVRIVVAGSAYNNGAVGSGLDDSVAVVRVLDGWGQVRWTRRMGGIGTELHAVLLERGAKGAPEVFVACNIQGPAVGSTSPLLCLSLEDGELVGRVETGTSVRRLASADVNQDGEPELVLLCDDGGLRIYDSSLRMLGSARVGIVSPRILQAMPLGPSGDPVLAVSAENGAALDFYDGKLRLLGRAGGGRRTITGCETMTLSSGRRMLVLAGEQGVSLYEVLAVATPHLPRELPDSGRPGTVTFLVEGLTAGILLILLVPLGFSIVSRGERRRRRIRSLVSELRIIRHGARIADGHREPLISLIRGLRTCSGSGGFELGGELLRQSMQTYHSMVAPALARILALTIMSGFVRPALNLAWARIQTSRRLRALVGKTGQAGAAAPKELRCARAAEAVGILEESLRRLETAALRRIQTDPLLDSQAAWEAVHVLFPRELAQPGGIELTGQVNVKAFVESADLRRILHDLLVNAAEAARDASEPRINLAIYGGESRVSIEITDNGRGVPREDQEAIFHGFSRKTPPGGQGLSHARRTVEGYSGRLFLRESKPWERTSFAIELYRVPC
jgi:signal transduction histidine kinase